MFMSPPRICNLTMRQLAFAAPIRPKGSLRFNTGRAQALRPGLPALGSSGLICQQGKAEAHPRPFKCQFRRGYWCEWEGQL